MELVIFISMGLLGVATAKYIEKRNYIKVGVCVVIAFSIQVVYTICYVLK